MSLKVVFANKFTEVIVMAVKYDMQLHRFIFITFSGGETLQRSTSHSDARKYEQSYLFHFFFLLLFICFGLLCVCVRTGHAHSFCILFIAFLF